MEKKLNIVYKRIKNINIRIKSFHEIYVSVPIGTPKSYVDKVLAKRAAWIEAKLSGFSKFENIQKPKYKSGESILYLGKNYTLKVFKSTQNRVILHDKTIELFVKVDEFAKKEELICSWYKEEAKKVFHEAIEKFHPLIQKDINRVSIKKMKTRWGSCNHTKGYINLNLHLIKTPLTCIEYVVFHELAHLIHPNHSKKFYRFLEKHMEDFKGREKRLGDFKLSCM